MKSVLHEASSILKAIEKAWEACGKPSEFSVKILEEGERALWFFSSKPAIVSISYDQKPLLKQHQSTSREKSNSRPHNAGGSTQERLLNGTTPPHLNNVTKIPPVRSQQHTKQPADQLRVVQKSAKLPLQQVTSQLQQDTSAVWTSELAAFTCQELREILHIMRITIPFQEKIDEKTLTITFAQSPMDNKEDARLFYVSLSYLLIQAAKKQEKKKLRGFHLIINSNA